MGQHFRLLGEAGPGSLLLDVTNFAVPGSQFIDPAFGFDRAEEFQQAQGFFEVAYGHENVAGKVGFAAGLDDHAPGTRLINTGQALALRSEGEEAFEPGAQFRPLDQLADEIHIAQQIVVTGHGNGGDRLGFRGPRLGKAHAAHDGDGHEHRHDSLHCISPKIKGVKLRHGSEMGTGTSPASISCVLIAAGLGASPRF